MNYYYVGVSLAIVLSVLLLVWLVFRKRRQDKPKKQVLPPTPLRTAGILQTVSFPQTPATWSTGLQWDKSWESQCVVFDTSLDRGLMVGVGRGMTDTNGGFLVHILAPDRASQQGEELLLFGLSDMLEPSQIRKLGMQKSANAGGFAKRTYWLHYDDKECTLGQGDVVGERVIFRAPHKCLSTSDSGHLRFIGFGTSCDSPHERTISRVGLC
jgi:hypothetical protein